MTAPRIAFAATASLLAATLATSGVALAHNESSHRSTGLPLGPPDLPETRTTRTLSPGVTLTTILRGTPDPNASWTVEIAIPSGAGSPDPDAPPAALKDQASAEATATRLRAAGLNARVESVPTPRLFDAGGNNLGYRVRVGAVPT